MHTFSVMGDQIRLSEVRDRAGQCSVAWAVDRENTSRNPRAQLEANCLCTYPAGMAMAVHVAY